jgi:hypothetical protein
MDHIVIQILTVYSLIKQQSRLIIHFIFIGLSNVRYIDVDNNLAQQTIKIIFCIGINNLMVSKIC